MRFLLAVLLLAALAAPAAADSGRRCLTAHERQAAVATHKLVRVSQAIRLVKARYGGDVVRVRLCRDGRRLVYLLTVLPRSGKVVHASVDAGSAAVGGS